jgi:DNA polymerase III alpha subunit
MDYAYENGCEALALTDHGNMNGMSYQVLHAKKMKKEGKNFKPIFGVEAYFIPSVEKWNEERDKVKQDKKRASEVKDDTSMSIENEAETKKSKSILNQRSHLVLLAQNQTGLNNIFSMISKSNSDEYFFRYPRVDYEVLREHSEGVIASSSACLTADAILNTDKGDETLGSVIERLHNQEEVFVLSYDTEQDKVCYRRVVWGDITRRNAEIVKIKLKNGETLRLTPDHKVYTDKGWIEAGDLKKHKGIKILCVKK